MTVPSSVNRSGPYSGNGVATVFDYDFRIVSATHLTVVRTVDGVDTIVSTSDYAVTGVGADNGTIVFTLAPATGQAITIIRNVPFTQETDLENQGAYYAETVEAAFDLAVMRDQQLEERLDRAIQIPVGADPSALPGLIENVLRLSDSVDNIDVVADNVDAVDELAEALPELVDNLTDITNFADVYQGPKASDPATRNDGSPLQSGDLYFNTTINLMRVRSSVGDWRDASSPSLNMSPKSFVGDGVTTAFPLDIPAGVAANVLVWVGGARQKPLTDYTVSGTTLTLLSAPVSGIEIDTLVVATVSPINIPADGSVTPAKIADGAVTLPKLANLGGGAGDYIADIPHPVAGWKTPAVLRTIFASQLSLKNSFGAKGDGLADDTAKLKDFEEWINGGTKREITIENGRYLLNDTLTITKNGATLKGGNRTAAVFAQQGNRDTLVFKPSDPATQFLYDVSVSKIGIEHDFAGGGPTSGRGMFIQKCVNPVFDKVSVVHAFGGIDIEGGFGHQFPGLNVGGGYTWSALAAGSFLLKLRSSTHNGSPQELSEIFFSDFNIKGASYAGNDYKLDNCVMIEGVDGVWFTGGHLGFAKNVQVVVSAQATVGHNIQNVHFSNTYVDGSFGGGVGIQAGGATGRTVKGFEFKGGAIKLLTSHGINWQLPASDVRLQGAEVNYCGGFGVIFNGVRDLHVDGNTIRDINRNNSGFNGMDVVSCGEFNIANNTIGGGSQNVVYGVRELSSVGKGIIANNVFNNYTTGGVSVATPASVTAVNNVG